MSPIIDPRRMEEREEKRLKKDLRKLQERMAEEKLRKSIEIRKLEKKLLGVVLGGLLLIAGLWTFVSPFLGLVGGITLVLVPLLGLAERMREKKEEGRREWGRMAEEERRKEEELRKLRERIVANPIESRAPSSSSGSSPISSPGRW